jgi:hypothetical protein
MRLDISDLTTINCQVLDRQTCPIPLSCFRDIQNIFFKKIIIFYICVQYDQEWGVYKWEIYRSHDETNIKINLDSSKTRGYKDESFIYQNPKKKKKYLIFSTRAFLALRVNPQYANIPFHKPSILINFQIHIITFFGSIINNAN